MKWLLYYNVMSAKVCRYIGDKRETYDKLSRLTFHV